MKTLFKNAKILTMADGDQFIDGCLLADGDEIAYIGSEEKEADEVIDCKGMVLMPSLKNAHTHSAMVLYRGVGEGLPLQEWLQVIWAEEAKLTENDVYEATKKCIDEYISQGTTAAFEMYFFEEGISRAFVEKGVRLVNLIVPNRDGEYGFIEESIKKWNKPGSLVTTVPGVHSEYLHTPVQLDACKALASKYNLPIFMHLSETEKEVKECRERHGMSPVMYFDSQGIWDFHSGGYHCIWFDEMDRMLFKKKGAWVVTCMGSNIKLEDGIPPLDIYYDEGIKIAIGSDGPASNLSLSLWREMKLVKGTFPMIPDYEVLKMATVNSAQAMGLDYCDTLQVGKKADLIVVDSDSVENLVQTTLDTDVKYVYVAGKQLLKRD